ncbi:MAG: hypothetical protein ACI8QZ_000530 [Chlamydiales bacterium]|jgi:hypothetical protein
MLRTAQHLLAIVVIASMSTAQGSFTTHGRGCPSTTTDSGPVLYGIMPASTWHLDHASLRFTSSFGSWSVSDGGQFIEHTDAATLLTLGDDALVGPLNLTFPFTYPGGAGSTTAIDVNSNGRIYLEAGTNPWSGGWSANGTLPNFLSATPSVCVLGTDMNTGAAGLLLFEVRTIGPDSVALITWECVPEYPNIGSNTFQCQLWSTGDVVLSYGDTNGSSASASALVGVSAGGGAANPGPSSLDVPLTLSLAAGIPVIGDSVTIAVSGVPFSATSAVLKLGQRGRVLPAGLTRVGGARLDCRMLIVPNAEVLMELTPPTAQVTLPWDYDPSLIGYRVDCQAVVFVPPPPGSGSTLMSDRGSLTLGEPPDLAFIVEGSNTFLGSPQSFGFFRLESSPGATHAGIERLEVKFTGSAQYFDTVGNAGLDGEGFFSDGNGQGPSCMNSYYGSDVTTGLVYGAPFQAPGCDGTGYTGWLGADAVGNSLTRYRRVTFAFDDFAAGEVFRFDCDTDGGGFDAGAQPVVVTVTLTDGTIISEPVQVVSNERAEGILIR